MTAKPLHPRHKLRNETSRLVHFPRKNYSWESCNVASKKDVNYLVADLICLIVVGTPTLENTVSALDEIMCYATHMLGMLIHSSWMVAAK